MTLARDQRPAAIRAALEAALAPLARHRRVYAALGDLMTTDIHALSIHARTPSEA